MQLCGFRTQRNIYDKLNLAFIKLNRWQRKITEKLISTSINVSDKYIERQKHKQKFFHRILFYLNVSITIFITENRVSQSVLEKISKYQAIYRSNLQKENTLSDLESKHFTLYFMYAFIEDTIRNLIYSDRLEYIKAENANSSQWFKSFIRLAVLIERNDILLKIL
ncbi:Hypothetical predicted protein [Octopus vulgaris]|uniref:Uncharacterized protein n=1 Tax=Octopus vulgaris TaxID=6645 RepID=A0AA36BP40_OCTVU|nr:Hypothetical predicted protein [Octopus vulgaris]